MVGIYTCDQRSESKRRHMPRSPVQTDQHICTETRLKWGLAWCEVATGDDPGSGTQAGTFQPRGSSQRQDL